MTKKDPSFRGVREIYLESFKARILSRIQEMSKGQWIRKRDLLRRFCTMQTITLDSIVHRLEKEEFIETMTKKTTANRKVFCIRSLYDEKGNKLHG